MNWKSCPDWEERIAEVSQKQGYPIKTHYVECFDLGQLDSNLSRRMQCRQNEPTYIEPHCKRMAARMRMGDAFPAIVVGKWRRQYFVIDGLNRKMACELNGDKVAKALVVPCDDKRILKLLVKAANRPDSVPQSEGSVARNVVDLYYDHWGIAEIADAFHRTIEEVGHIIAAEECRRRLARLGLAHLGMSSTEALVRLQSLKNDAVFVRAAILATRLVVEDVRRLVAELNTRNGDPEAQQIMLAKWEKKHPGPVTVQKRHAVAAAVATRAAIAIRPRSRPIDVLIRLIADAASRLERYQAYFATRPAEDLERLREALGELNQAASTVLQEGNLGTQQAEPPTASTQPAVGSQIARPSGARRGDQATGASGRRQAAVSSALA